MLSQGMGQPKVKGKAHGRYGHSILPNDNGAHPGDEIRPVNGLTCIHGRIHCVATQDATDECDELQQLQVQHFLSTLAEVALAIARRRGQL